MDKKSFEHLRSSQPYDIIVMADGSYLVSGEMIEESTSDYDAMLLKFESDFSLCSDFKEVISTDPILVDGGLTETSTASSYSFEPFSPQVVAVTLNDNPLVFTTLR